MSDVTLALHFGRDGNADPHLGVGWSAGETGYRWMTGGFSEIWLENLGADCDFALELDLHPFVSPPALPFQRLVVQARGIEIGRERLTKPGTFRWSIPKALLASVGPVRLTFLHPDGRQPKEIGVSDDERTLTVSTHSLRLMRDTQDRPSDAEDFPPDGLAAPAVLSDNATIGSTVFVGNCQMNVLAGLYRMLCPPDGCQHVAYIASYQEATASERRIIAEANVLVQQVLDFAPRIGDLQTQAKVHLVPHITGAFLWPYTGHAHPRNRPEPFLDPGGPYPPELGNSFLNKKISDQTDADVAVAEYLATDVATVKRADRLLEIFLDKQRTRDNICGFQFADYIHANFRTKCLFRSPNHPDGDMVIKFVTDVFGRLEVAPGDAERVLTAGRYRLFPATETPIHASIATHFGLTYAPLCRRYCYFNEGSFTFREFASRYMNYTWNALLAEGLHLIRMKQLDAGVVKLEAAMPTAPRAAYARMVLADVLERVGRTKDAVEYACQAVEIEPNNVRYVERLMQISGPGRVPGDQSARKPGLLT